MFLQGLRRPPRVNLQAYSDFIHSSKDVPGPSFFKTKRGSAYTRKKCLINN